MKSKRIKKRRKKIVKINLNNLWENLFTKNIFLVLIIFMCLPLIFIYNYFISLNKEFKIFKKEYNNAYDFFITIFIILFSLLVSEIIYIGSLYTREFLVNTQNAYIPLVLVVALVYLFSAVILGKLFAVYQNSLIKKYSKSSYKIDFSMVLGATSITLILHIVLFMFTPCPIWFLRLVGFIFDLYLLQLIQFYFTPVHVFGNFKDFLFYTSYKYPSDKSLFKKI